MFSTSQLCLLPDLQGRGRQKVLRTWPGESALEQEKNTFLSLSLSSLFIMSSFYPFFLHFGYSTIDCLHLNRTINGINVLTNLYMLMKTHTPLSISTYLLIWGFSQTSSLRKNNLTGMGSPCRDKCHKYLSALLTPSSWYKQDRYLPDVNLVLSPGTLWLSLGTSSHWGQDCFLPHPLSPCRSCFSHTGSPWAPSTSSHREWDEMTVLPQKQWDLFSPFSEATLL